MNSSKKIETSDIFRHAYLMIGDERFTFETQGLNQDSEFEYGVRFEQRELLFKDTAKNFSFDDVPKMVRKVMQHHPMKGLLSWPKYTLFINQKDDENYITGLVGPRRCLAKTPISKELVMSLMESPELYFETDIVRSLEQANVEVIHVSFKQEPMN